MNIASFDLNLLRVLDALLHEGSTVRAGDRIGLSQPAVSAALARLRHAIGDPLFVRQGGRLVPTDYARGLQRPLRRLLDDIGALLDGPEAFDPAVSDATFKLSGADFFSEFLMPALARDIATHAPGMRLQMLDLVPDDNAATLDRYEVDLALVPDMDLPDWIDRQPVFASRYVVVACAEHRGIAEAGVPPGGVLPMDLYCALGHVLFSPEGKLRSVGDAALAAMNRTRRVVITVPLFTAVCRAVSQSELVALVPHQFAERVAGSMGLAIYQPPMKLEPVCLSMIWHKRSTANPAHRWVRQRIADILVPLAPECCGPDGRSALREA